MQREVPVLTLLVPLTSILAAIAADHVYLMTGVISA